MTVGGNGWCDGQGAAGCGNPNSQGFGVVDCDYPASGTTPAVGDRACDALGATTGLPASAPRTGSARSSDRADREDQRPVVGHTRHHEIVDRDHHRSLPGQRHHELHVVLG